MSKRKAWSCRGAEGGGELEDANRRTTAAREAVQLISRLSCAVNFPDALAGKVSARARVSRGPAHGPHA